MKNPISTLVIRGARGSLSCCSPGDEEDLMYDEKKERWLQLCEQAAVEQDPNKILKLVTEINRLLVEKRLYAIPHA